MRALTIGKPLGFGVLHDTTCGIGFLLAFVFATNRCVFACADAIISLSNRGYQEQKSQN